MKKYKNKIKQIMLSIIDNEYLISLNEKIPEDIKIPNSDECIEITKFKDNLLLSSSYYADWKDYVYDEVQVKDHSDLKVYDRPFGSKYDWLEWSLQNKVKYCFQQWKNGDGSKYDIDYKITPVRGNKGKIIKIDRRYDIV